MKLKECVSNIKWLKAALFNNGGSGKSRTYDLPLRRGLLYPTELRIRIGIM